MWRQWLQQVEGLVMLPDAEAEPSDAWTKQERAASHRACEVERRTHSNAVKRQHMFTVRSLAPKSTAFQAHASTFSCSMTLFTELQASTPLI